MDFRVVICLLCLVPFPTEAGLDNQGTQFILCFMSNYPGYPTEAQLFISTTSNSGANVNVTTPLYAPDFLESIVVQRAQVVKVTLPGGIIMSGTALEEKGILVQSDQEIVVFGVNTQEYTADAYLATPVDVLGMEYYVMTYTSSAQIGIVATEDSTDVTVTLPDSKCGILSVQYNGTQYTDNDAIDFTLNRLQTLQLYDESNTINCDFTGAHVVANKPITVLAGNVLGFPPYQNMDSGDHLTEQMPPIENLGKTFYTYSTPERSVGDLVRIMAVNDSTSVSIGDGTSRTLNTAEFAELDVATGTYLYIESDKAVIVCLFSKSFKNDGSNGGDPSMTLLVPQAQWAADYTYATVQTPEKTEYVNQIVVHIDQTQVDGLKLDEADISVTWSPILGSSDIVVGVFDVSDGSHNIYHTDPTVVFSAIATGVANFSSYAFPVGSRLAKINTVCVNSSTVAGDTIDNDCDNLIDEETLNGIDDDGDALVDEDLATPPRVDGNWGTWTSWSNCSETCEAIGSQTRIRNCDNPAPANNGQDCAGNGTEIIVCNMTAIGCPVDGNWGPWTSWSSCSETCEAIGSQTRIRKCDNPTPANNGQDCAGNGTEVIVCNMTAIGCPVDGNWGPWTSWSNCSETCEAIGSQTRIRNCDNPAPANNGQDCAGNGTDIIVCNMTAIGCPVDGNWGPWTSWSSCSETCEAIGSQTRIRKCDNPTPANNGQDCAGNGTEVIVCNMTAIGCPVDGNWGPWTSWSNCSETCEAIGSQTRIRNCDNPAPANNGQDCAGNGTDIIVCNMTAIGCPVDGNWGLWTSWSSCSETCEAIGSQTRIRNCDNPAPANNGQDCAGNGTEVIVCNMTAIGCPVDGSWTMWSSWDNCTGLCGTGTQFRDRDCANPSPQNGGKECVGAAKEAHTCVLASACLIASTAAVTVGATFGASVILVTMITLCILYVAARRRRQQKTPPRNPQYNPRQMYFPPKY